MACIIDYVHMTALRWRHNEWDGAQITSFTIVYSTVYPGADQRKHQSPASMVFVRGIHRTVEFPAQMASNAETVSIWWRHHANGCVPLFDCGLDRSLEMDEQLRDTKYVGCVYWSTSDKKNPLRKYHYNDDTLFTWWGKI